MTEKGGGVAGSVIVGVVAGIVSVTLTVALAALVFSGDLAEHRAAGIGLGLFGTAAVSVVIATRSSLPGMMSGIQDNTTAILALGAVSVAAEVDDAAVLPTVVALVVVTSVLLGLLLVVVGSLRLGRLVRFLPFPVVAGLLAGTGVVIIVFAFGILTGDAAVSDFVSGAFESDVLIRWAPGVVSAAALLLGTRGVLKPPAVGVVVAGGIVSTYAWLYATGSSIAAEQQSGLLLGSFSAGPIWTPSLAGKALDADWGVLLGLAGEVGTILLLVPVTLLLYVGAIELAVRRDVDADRELRVAGLGNVVAAAGGGLPGYQYVADTVLAARLAPPRRLTAIVAAATVVVIMLGGAPLLGLIPTSFIGAILLFIGAAFALEWTWDARARLSGDDMAVVVAILLTITFVGFLPGVALGLGAAVVLFVVRSSRLEVVKFELDGTGYRSRVDRDPEARAFLDGHGSQLMILELQSYLFFGTADRLRSRISRRLEGEGRLRCLIIGFSHVTGIDSSALLAFEKLDRLAEPNGVQIILCGVPRRLESQILPLAHSEVVTVAPDIDRAVEQAEDLLLAERADVGEAEAGAHGGFDSLERHFTEVTIEPGGHLMVQDEPSRGLFLVREGRVSVVLDTGSGATRLRSMGSGAVVGEVSLFLGAPCTANVVADTEVVALRLSPEDFDRIQREEPAAAAELNRLTARVLAQRLDAADHMIERLLS